MDKEKEEIYEKFRQKLDTLSVPSPDTEDKLVLRILERLMTPQEVEIGCHMEEEHESVETIAKRIGMEPDKLKPILEEMARKGVIRGLHGEYALIGMFAAGMYDYQVHRLDPETVWLFEEYFTTKWGEVLATNKVGLLRVVPIHQTIPAESQILIYEEVERGIKESKEIALVNCVCKASMRAIGKGCNYPYEEMCILLDPEASSYIEYGRGRRATKEEALAVLRKAEDAGLVHCAINVQAAGAVCNCCSCCCQYLRGILELKVPNAVAYSNFVVELKEDKCNGCGDCVERCQLHLIKPKDSQIAIEIDRCIGCGLCASKCTTGALTMKRKAKEDQIIPPKDFFELFSTIKEGPR